MTTEATAARTRKPQGEPVPTTTTAPEAAAEKPKPRRIPAPIDPETRAMRRVESVLAELSESDPTAPARVLEYLLARRKSRAMFAPRSTDPDYPNAGP